jgi:hypothetical protein
MPIEWKWEPQSKTYGNYGNANQWTVNAGLPSLAREATQNTNDARSPTGTPELVYTFLRLRGAAKAEFLDAVRWDQELSPHLQAMAGASSGAVAAGQIKSGLETFADADSLVLLRIADYGCEGLTGPEFPDGELEETDFGNFIKLCRLDLFSGKNRTSGGSFGLGKAVYWRFSRIQTVIFNSRVDRGDGGAPQRLIGVNQGVMHRLNGEALQGRGYFGAPDENGDVGSVWDQQPLIDALHLTRPDDRTGTSALLIGFYDPDRPDLGGDSGAELVRLAEELREGVSESFWPLLTRNRLRVRIEVFDGTEALMDTTVDPEDDFTELVQALRRFDRGELDETLEDPLSTVCRDVPIQISRRRTADGHDAFVHQAKLVVTVSDSNADPLENRVCLFRQPEMVVETIERQFEGRTYHAFLLAGAAIDPTSPTDEDIRADDFLRFAEPPSHDRWIPGRGRGQTSQANLTAHYVAPWVPNLRSIHDHVVDALQDLFGAPPPSEDKPPEVIFKHLRFLRGDTGESPGGGGAGGGRRKPEIEILDGHVVDGRWQVTCRVRAPNRDEGWSMAPRLALMGLEGRQVVPWESWELVDGPGELRGLDQLVIPAVARRRRLTTTFRAVTVGDLPLPAEETAVEAVLRGLDVAPGTATETETVADDGDVAA